MSTFTHDFTGRKPSKTQVKKVAQQAIKTGASWIEINWGENWLRIHRNGFPSASSHRQHWIGSGWIRGISGDDIAKELSNEH